MKTSLYLPLILVGAVLNLVGCADEDNDNRPIPGTVEATTTKDPANENNTPRTNPTPNPEPASNPPGPQSDMHPAGTVPPQ
jgi:hypothetical protein